MAHDTAELFDAYIDQEKLYRTEGRRGLEHLCQLVRAIGYKDQQHFGQLNQKAAIGDLICFLEDNSGAIEAIQNWIREQNSAEFSEALKSNMEPRVIDQYEDGVCPDCGEEINPSLVRGEACDNCGHVFNWGENDSE